MKTEWKTQGEANNNMTECKIEILVTFEKFYERNILHYVRLELKTLAAAAPSTYVTLTPPFALLRGPPKRYCLMFNKYRGKGSFPGGCNDNFVWSTVRHFTAIVILKFKETNSCLVITFMIRLIHSKTNKRLETCRQ